MSVETPESILQSVYTAFDRLIETSDRYNGLFPSILDRETGRMLDELPAPIAGQRPGDRCHLGNNLMHDEAALKTMYALSKIDRPDYADAGDRYLSYFAKHCTDTVTGLFPWGEHAFRHLTEHRTGSSREHANPESAGRAIHDHLRQAPIWLWDKLAEYNPECVIRFAEGLDYHWTEGDGWEYIRHAPIEEKSHPNRGGRSCDFPRHGGFYILDWAYAYRLSSQPDFLQQVQRMLDYWWALRDERNLLLIESRSPKEDTHFYNTNAPGQTLSLAASLLESIPLLESRHPDICMVMRERALAYIDGFLAAPHDVENKIFVILSRRENNVLHQAMPIWGSVYGVWPASYVALTALCASRLTGDQRLADWSESVGICYLEDPMPEGIAVPAMDAGLGLSLLAELYDISGEEKWLEGGLTLAGSLMDVYFDADLPRGAAGIDWYESQMGPGFLLHGLTRIALLAQDRTGCPLDADFTAR